MLPCQNLTERANKEQNKRRRYKKESAPQNSGYMDSFEMRSCSLTMLLKGSFIILPQPPGGRAHAATVPGLGDTHS